MHTFQHTHLSQTRCSQWAGPDLHHHCWAVHHPDQVAEAADHPDQAAEAWDAADRHVHQAAGAEAPPDHHQAAEGGAVPDRRAQVAGAGAPVLGLGPSPSWLRGFGLGLGVLPCPGQLCMASANLSLMASHDHLSPLLEVSSGLSSGLLSQCCDHCLTLSPTFVTSLVAISLYFCSQGLSEVLSPAFSTEAASQAGAVSDTLVLDEVDLRPGSSLFLCAGTSLSISSTSNHTAALDVW